LSKQTNNIVANKICVVSKIGFVAGIFGKMAVKGLNSVSVIHTYNKLMNFLCCFWCRTWYKVALSALFAFFLALLCVSRCYIATHFPHQVIVGALIGKRMSLKFWYKKSCRNILVHC